MLSILAVQKEFLPETFLLFCKSLISEIDILNKDYYYYYY